MYVLCVTIYVRPENIHDFLTATVAYASLVRQEGGNVRYDVLQSEDDSTCFVVYEAYRSKEDFLIHRKTAHSIRWKEDIEAWMARPRQRIRGNSLVFRND